MRHRHRSEFISSPSWHWTSLPPLLLDLISTEEFRQLKPALFYLEVAVNKASNSTQPTQEKATLVSNFVFHMYLFLFCKDNFEFKTIHLLAWQNFYTEKVPEITGIVYIVIHCLQKMINSEVLKNLSLVG